MVGALGVLDASERRGSPSERSTCRARLQDLTVSAFYADTVLFKRLLSCPRHWLRCRSECERYITSRKLKGVACAVLLACAGGSAPGEPRGCR